jgi:hypothetical protein
MTLLKNLGHHTTVENRVMEEDEGTKTKVMDEGAGVTASRPTRRISPHPLDLVVAGAWLLEAERGKERELPVGAMRSSGSWSRACEGGGGRSVAPVGEGGGGRASPSTDVRRRHGRRRGHRHRGRRGRRCHVRRNGGRLEEG